MPQKTEAQLTTEINIIANETVDGANTAARVGGTLDNINVSKVEKVSGKGLSANDYSNAEKAKVTAAEAHAANTSNPHGVTKAQVGLGSADNTSDAAKPVSTAQATAIAAAVATEATNRAAADTAINATLAAKADLVAGKVPTSQLPAITIGESFSVASQAAMLALTAQIGDVAIRTDQSNAKYILLGTDATVLGNWVSLAATGAVTSVNGQSGIVVLGYADVGAAAASHTHAATAITEDATHRFTTDTEKTTWNSKVDAAGALAAAPAETATTLGALTAAAASKATPVDADYLGGIDSAASNIWKKFSWANIKATLKTYFDSLYKSAATFEADVLDIIESVDTVTPSFLPIVNANHTLTTADEWITVDASTTAVSITALSVGAGAGKWWKVKVINATNPVTLIGSFNGGTNYVINQAGEANFFADTATYRLTFLPAAIPTMATVMPAGGTTGQVLSKVNGTDYNTQWVTPSSGGGGGADVSSWPIFKATHATAQTLTANAWTKLAFGTTVIDSATAWNSSLKQYTIPAGQGGTYRLTVKLQFTSASPSNLETFLGAGKIDGEGNIRHNINGFVHITTAEYVAGDVLYASVYLNAGSNQNSDVAEFVIERIR